MKAKNVLTYFSSFFVVVSGFVILFIGDKQLALYFMAFGIWLAVVRPE